MATPSAWSPDPERLDGFNVTSPTDGLQGPVSVGDNSGENFGIAYRTGGAGGTHIRFRAFGHALEPLAELLAGPVDLDDGQGTILGGPAMVGWGDGYAAVWQEQDGAGGPVLLKVRLTGPASVLGGEFALAAPDPNATAPVVAQHSASLSAYEIIRGADIFMGFNAAWVSTVRTADGTTEDRVMLQRIVVPPDALGNPLLPVAAGMDGLPGGDDDAPIEIGTGTAPSMAVAHDGETVIVWIGADGSLRGRMFDAGGVELTNSIALPAGGAGVSLGAALAGIRIPAGHAARVAPLGAGNFGVFWVAQNDAPGALAGDLVVKGLTFVVGDAAGTWDAGAIRTVLDLPEGANGYLPGSFAVAGLGEANDGGVITYGTLDGRVFAQSFDGAAVGTPGAPFQVGNAGLEQGHAVTGLVGDRVVVVWADPDLNGGDIEAQILDTRAPGQVLVGDRVRDNNGDGVPERVDARPDLIVGTIGGDTVVADRGDARGGRGETDTVLGGMGRDTIWGGGDDDSLDGGLDADTVAYAGPRTRYSITINGDGSFTVKDMGGGINPGADGVDTIRDFETVAFGSSVATQLGQGGRLTVGADQVSMDLFLQTKVAVTDIGGVPQPWGMTGTGDFAVNTGPTLPASGPAQGLQLAPTAVALENSFAFVWETDLGGANPARHRILVKAYNTLGAPDSQFGIGAGPAVAQTYQLNDATGIATKPVAAMAGDLGVVAVWEERAAAGAVTAANPSAIKGRFISSIDGIVGDEFQVKAAAAGRVQHDAAVAGYEVVDAANDTVEFGFHVLYTEGAAGGDTGRILLDRFTLYSRGVDGPVVQERPASSVGLDGRTGTADDIAAHEVSANGRDAAAAVLHDGELAVTYIEGGALKAKIYRPATEFNAASPDFNVTRFASVTQPAGAGQPDPGITIAALAHGTTATQQILALGFDFLVAYQDGAGGPVRLTMFTGAAGTWTPTALGDFALPPGATGEFHVAATAEDDLGTGFAVFFEVSSGGQTGIQGQVFDHGGVKLHDAPFTVQDGDTLLANGTFSATGLVDGRLVVAAQGQAGPTTDPDGIVGRVLDTRVPGEPIIGPRDGAPRDVLVGTAGNDAMDGRALEDELYGGLGDDLLTGGTENDTLDGGLGNDTLLGGSEDDLLLGGAGDDLLLGGFGADTINGGAGNDTVSYQGEFADFSVNLGAAAVAGTNQPAGSTWSTRDPATGATRSLGAEDTLVLVDHATGGEGNDTILGSAGHNRLSGGGGADSLVGGAGNDLLDGGAGVDRMAGGLDSDTYRVDSADDVVVELAGEGSDKVLALSQSYVLPENVERLSFVGVGNFAGTGNGGVNIIEGGAGDDRLNGAGGNDTVTGGAGNDLLEGGLGADSLGGGEGNDTLVGGLNNDRLDGGAGSDVFRFDARFGQDQVFGFADGEDLLELAGLGVTQANFATAVRIAQVGADTVVTIGTNTVTLLGVDAETIGQADFLFA